MAYQNVGTPRFYLDLPSYLNSIGQDITNNQYLGLNCSIMQDIPYNNLSFDWNDNLPFNIDVNAITCIKLAVRFLCKCYFNNN